jgi:hypothetical protein
MFARALHDAYERLAPEFGYETRKESAVPWDEVPEANRRLMVAAVEQAMWTFEITFAPALIDGRIAGSTNA